MTNIPIPSQLRTLARPAPDCMPGRHCERHARGLGGCVAGTCNRPAPAEAGHPLPPAKVQAYADSNGVPPHGVPAFDPTTRGWFAALADARLSARKAGNDWLVSKLDEIHQYLLPADGVTPPQTPSKPKKACKSDPTKECVFGPCYFGGPCHAEAERTPGMSEGGA